MTDNTLEGNEQAPHWRFLGTVVWGSFIGALYILLQVFVVIVMIARRHGNLSEAELEKAFADSVNDGTILSWAAITTALICTLLLVGIIKLKRGAVVGEYLALKRVALSDLGRWVALTLVLVVAYDSIGHFLHRPVVPPFVSSAYASAHPVWLLWVALVLAAPLFEEVFFRGFLFRGIQSSLLGTKGAVIITAALWSILHVQYDWYDISAIFGLGLLLGIARAKCDSLLIPLGLHSLSNLLATIEAATLA